MTAKVARTTAAGLDGPASKRSELHLVVRAAQTSSSAALANRSQSNEDSVYEQDILRDPSSIKPWLVYIDFKSKHGSIHEKSFVMARACAQLPRSYKLWKMVRARQTLTADLRQDKF